MGLAEIGPGLQDLVRQGSHEVMQQTVEAELVHCLGQNENMKTLAVQRVVDRRRQGQLRRPGGADGCMRLPATFGFPCTFSYLPRPRQSRQPTRLDPWRKTIAKDTVKSAGRHTRRTSYEGITVLRT